MRLLLGAAGPWAWRFGRFCRLVRSFGCAVAGWVVRWWLVLAVRPHVRTPERAGPSSPTIGLRPSDRHCRASSTNRTVTIRARDQVTHSRVAVRADAATLRPSGEGRPSCPCGCWIVNVCRSTGAPAAADARGRRGGRAGAGRIRSRGWRPRWYGASAKAHKALPSGSKRFPGAAAVADNTLKFRRDEVEEVVWIGHGGSRVDAVTFG